MALTFVQLQDAIDDLAGLDLDEDHRDRLINEGYAELCTRSEFLRGRVEIGPGVADDYQYAIPSNVYRILSVDVEGVRYNAGNDEEYNRLLTGDSFLTFGTTGLWWRSYGSTGVEQVAVYPTPAGDESIIVYGVLRPDELSDDDDTPLIPPEFHRSILDYVAAIAFASVEDNVDLRSYYRGEFDRAVGELRRLTFSTGREPTFMQTTRARW